MFGPGVFIAAGNRCAVDFEALQLPVSDEEALIVLAEMGYNSVQVSISELARNIVGKAEYIRLSQPHEAPQRVDCSSFTQWLYAQKGILIPRHAIDQRDYVGPPYISRFPFQLQEGDLLFTTGRHDWYWEHSAHGVGHVGIYTKEGTVIHAANARRGVVEDALKFFSKKQDQGTVRVIPHPARTYTLECPTNKPVQFSTAFRWKILSTIKR